MCCAPKPTDNSANGGSRRHRYEQILNSRRAPRPTLHLEPRSDQIGVAGQSPRLNHDLRKRATRKARLLRKWNGRIDPELGADAVLPASDVLVTARRGHHDQIA